MKSTINSLAFKNEWGEGDKKTYYFNVSLSGESKPVSLGVKSIEPLPDWFKVNEEIEWEWFNEEKRSIKRIAPKKGFGGKAGFVDQSTAQFISAAMSNTTTMLLAGAIDKEKIEDTMRYFVQVSVQLKGEFK